MTDKTTTRTCPFCGSEPITMPSGDGTGLMIVKSDGNLPRHECTGPRDGLLGGGSSSVMPSPVSPGYSEGWTSCALCGQKWWTVCWREGRKDTKVWYDAAGREIDRIVFTMMEEPMEEPMAVRSFMTEGYKP